MLTHRELITQILRIFRAHDVVERATMSVEVRMWHHGDAPTFEEPHRRKIICLDDDVWDTQVIPYLAAEECKSDSSEDFIRLPARHKMKSSAQSKSQSAPMSSAMHAVGDEVRAGIGGHVYTGFQDLS